MGSQASRETEPQSSYSRTHRNRIVTAVERRCQPELRSLRELLQLAAGLMRCIPEAPDQHRAIPEFLLSADSRVRPNTPTITHLGF